jgi:hypothetical protein
MNTFLIGLRRSGRTTLAQAICQDKSYQHISTAWFQEGFRKPKDGETDQHFLDAYYQYFSQTLQEKPRAVVDVVKSALEVFQGNHCIIDGIQSPRDFTELFDYNRDMVIFLNRIDAPVAREFESIGVSVIRDYCFWLASSGLLKRKQWHEYNFKIPGEESDFIKELGSKNRVFLTKNLGRVIESVKEALTKQLVQ